MWWFDHDDDNEDEMMPNHKQKVGWWMHILENCLRKETYILLVIQKQTISTPRHFAAGGAFVPTQEKNKNKKQKQKQTISTPRHFRRWGGGKMPTQEKKNKPSHLIAGKSYLNQSVLEKLF